MSPETGTTGALAANLERQIAAGQEAFFPLAQLHLLCPAAIAMSEEFRCVAEFAAARSWRFAFLPHQVIRFTPIAPLP